MYCNEVGEKSHTCAFLPTQKPSILLQGYVEMQQAITYVFRFHALIFTKKYYLPYLQKLGRYLWKYLHMYLGRCTSFLLILKSTTKNNV